MSDIKGKETDNIQTTFNKDGFDELFEESEVDIDNVYTENNETGK